MSDSRRRAAFFFGCDISFATEDETGFMVSPGGADPRLFIRLGREIPELLGFESSVFTLERPREHEHHHLSDSITYGVRLSIRHKQSGMLLALLPSQPSSVDGNCHTLTLVSDADATANSHFRLIPRYKIHSEGDYVCHGDELLIQLFDRQLYFHTSEAGMPVTELTLKSSVVDENTIEVNGSDTPSAWTIRRYDFGVEDPEFHRETIRCGRNSVFSGAPVVLVHREKEAHLISSVTKPKVSLNRSRSGRAMTRSRHRNCSTTVPEFLGSTMSGLRTGRGALPHPLFFPADNALGADPSFLDLQCSCSALWIFEGPLPMEGGPLRLGEPYRLRQAATNLYLSVVPRSHILGGSPQIGLAGNGFNDEVDTNQGANSLAKCFSPADMQLSLVPAPETPEELQNTLFSIQSVFSSELKFVTEQEFIRLQHYTTGLWVKTEQAEDGIAEEKEKIHGIRLALETKPATHDALLMGHVKAEMQRNVLFLFHNGEFLRRYREAFSDASLMGPDQFTMESFNVTVKCAADALACLIRFCSDSDDQNPLTREGLPIAEHQRMMFDLQFHRIVFDVLVAPFVEGDRATHLPSLPFDGGVIDIARLLEPQYSQVHVVCRLCYRLLKQMIRGTPSLSTFLVDYIPFMYYQDGLKLHVADTMMEIFTCNPNMPAATYASAVDHYVNLLKSKSRSSGYIKFLATMSCVDNKTPIPANQYLVCKNLLTENPQTMLKITLMEDGGVGVIWKRTEAPLPVLDFLLHHPDLKLVKFFESQIHLYNTLSLGSQEATGNIVEAFIPSMQLTAMAKRLLQTEEELPRIDATRANIFELAMNLYIIRDLQDPEVLLKANTILLGGSTLRHNHEYYSGRTDTELMKTIKTSAVKFLEDNPSQIMENKVRNSLLTTTIEVWTTFVSHWQYTEREELTLLPLLLRLLDGQEDKFSTKKAYGDTEEIVWDRYARSEENLTAMRTKQSACHLIGKLIDNGVHKTANDILEFIYIKAKASGIQGSVLSSGICSNDSSPMHNRGGADRRSSNTANLASPMLGGTTASSSAYANETGNLSEAEASAVVEEIKEYIDTKCSQLEARFRPSRLVPLLVDVARYNSVCLSDAAMDLLVSLANVRRSVAKRVKSVDLCPDESVIKTFDELFVVAAELQLASNSDAEDLDDAVSMLLKTLENKPLNDWGGGFGSHASSTSTLSTTLPGAGSTTSPTHTQQTDNATNDNDEGSPSPSGSNSNLLSATRGLLKRRSSERRGSMWGSARAVVKVMAFTKKVQKKRKEQLGNSEPEVNVEMLRRAEMMRHWGVHKTLLRALRIMPLDHISYRSIMEFFYLFSMAPSNAIELARHVTLFVQGIPHPTAHNHCMHVVISIISSGSANTANNGGAVDKNLLGRLVDMIVKEKSQRTPDASFVRLVNRSVIGTNMLPANQRFLLSLLHSQQVFSSIGDVSPRWSSSQLVFNTALVMLLCNCCANNPGSRHMAQRILPSPIVFSILNVKSRKEELPVAHQSPYYRLLATVFLTLDEESPQERARLKQSWMKNDSWWDLMASKIIPHFNLITKNVSESTAMRTDDIVLYREFTFLAVLGAVIAFFKDCFIVSVAARSEDTVDLLIDFSQAIIKMTESLCSTPSVDLRHEEWVQVHNANLLVSNHMAELEITAVTGGFQRVLNLLVSKLAPNENGGNGGGITSGPTFDDPSQTGGSSSKSKNGINACEDASLPPLVRADTYLESMSADSFEKIDFSSGSGVFLAHTLNGESFAGSFSSPSNASMAQRRNQDAHESGPVRARRGSSFFDSKDNTNGAAGAESFAINDDENEGESTAAIFVRLLQRGGKHIDAFIEKTLVHMKQADFVVFSCGGLLRAFTSCLTNTPEDQLESMQSHLDRLGMMKVVTSLTQANDRGIVQAALALGVALLEGGNKTVQDHMLHYFNNTDEHFFRDIREMIGMGIMNARSRNMFKLQERGGDGVSLLPASSGGDHSKDSTNPSSPTSPRGGHIAPHASVWSHSKSPVAGRSLGNGHGVAGRTLLGNSLSSSQATIVAEMFENVRSVFRMLQLMCEGHHFGMQNYIRVQSDNLHSINIVFEVVKLMKELCSNIDKPILPIVNQGFALLTEFCQGPCEENQISLINANVCTLICQALDTHFGEDIDDGADEELCSLKQVASTTLLALLEGRSERHTIARIVSQVSPIAVVQHAVNLSHQIGDSTDQHRMRTKSQDDDDDSRLDTLFNLIIYLKQVMPHASEEKQYEVQSLLQQKLSHLQQLLGCIEIQRGDQLENVYFRIPFICTSLTSQSKDKLLWSVDRSTRSTKLADFFHQSDELIFEMETAHAFQNGLYKNSRFDVEEDEDDADASEASGESGEAKKASKKSGKWTLYWKSLWNKSIAPYVASEKLDWYEGLWLALAITMNLMLVMGDRRGLVTISEEDFGLSSNNDTAALLAASSSVDDDLGVGFSPMSMVWFMLSFFIPQLSLRTVMFLTGLAQLVLCSILLGIDSMVYLPVYLYSIEKRRERAASRGATDAALLDQFSAMGSDGTTAAAPPGGATAWSSSSPSSMAAAAKNSTAGQSHSPTASPAASPLGADSSHHHSPLSHDGIEPTSIFGKLVVAVTTKPRQNMQFLLLCSNRFATVFRLTMVLTCLAGLMVSPYFFAVHLVGLVNKSSVLRNVIVAITQNGKSLLLTMALGVVMVFMFSILGLEYFPEAFTPEGTDPDDANCSSLSRCFVYILIHGLRQGGGVGDVMEREKWDSPNHLGRLAYDFLFFALLNVVFLNILFGIIIDTFAELRDDKRKREEDMHSNCFICGVDSDTFDKEGGGFTRHVKQEHNMWQYLYFMHHLRRKDPNEFTGQESFVAEMIKRQNLSFFPQGISRTLLQSQMAHAAGSGGTSSSSSALLLPNGSEEGSSTAVTLAAKSVGGVVAGAGEEPAGGADTDTAKNPFTPLTAGGAAPGARQVTIATPGAAPTTTAGAPAGSGGGATAATEINSAVRDAVNEVRSLLSEVEQSVRKVKGTEGSPTQPPPGGRARRPSIMVGEVPPDLGPATAQAFGNADGGSGTSATGVTTPTTNRPRGRSLHAPPATLSTPATPDHCEKEMILEMRHRIDQLSTELEAEKKEKAKLQQEVYLARQQAKTAQDEADQFSDELKLLMQEHEQEIESLRMSLSTKQPTAPNLSPNAMSMSLPPALSKKQQQAQQQQLLGSSAEFVTSGTFDSNANMSMKDDQPPVSLEPSPDPQSPSGSPQPLKSASSQRASMLLHRRRSSITKVEKKDVGVDPIPELVAPTPSSANLSPRAAAALSSRSRSSSFSSAAAKMAKDSATIMAANTPSEILDSSSRAVTRSVLDDENTELAVHVAVLHKTATDALQARDEWKNIAETCAEELEKCTDDYFASEEECKRLRQINADVQTYLQNKLMTDVERTIVEIITEREGQPPTETVAL